MVEKVEKVLIGCERIIFAAELHLLFISIPDAFRGPGI